jgi:hypothetical protein
VSLTDAQFVAWLRSADCIRCALVEVQARIAGVETTLYLSNRNYVTSPTDAPASTAYQACVVGGVKFSERLSLDGSPSLSWGDIELDNTGGVRDDWFTYVWANRRVQVYIGDVRWLRADFRRVFDGVVGDLGSRDANVLNLALLDKLQRLNVPLSEDTLGGSTANANALLPLAFGECHNVAPLLRDPATLEYQVHAGAMERLIEVRDNGAPVTATATVDTGRFTLAAAPVGTITASMQGAATGQNITPWSADFSNAVWTKTRTTVQPNAAVALDGMATADRLVESTATGTHAVGTASLAVSSNAPYTWNLIARAAERYCVRLRAADSIGFLGDAIVDLRDGALVGGSASPIDLGGGYWWISFQRTTNAAAITATLQVYIWSDAATSSYTGDGVSGLVLERAWLQEGAMATLAPPTGASGGPIYVNTVAELVKTLVTSYGPSGTRFTEDDLDLVSIATFGATCPQPVGLYAAERVNLLAACQQLAASVGAQVVATSQGLLRLVRIALPTAAATVITAEDMDYRGLRVSERPAVRAACKLLYCRNWQPQPSGLAAGLPADSVDLFAREWLATTAADSTAASVYMQGSEPVGEETLLLTDADATAESQRRLDLWATPRTIFSATCRAHMLLTELGDAVTLQHARFGLSAGKPGLVLSIDRDWLQGRIELGVLV